MSRPMSATLAPEFKNLKAVARPTPDEAPVMRTRLRAKLESWLESISSFILN